MKSPDRKQRPQMPEQSGDTHLSDFMSEPPIGAVEPDMDAIKRTLEGRYRLEDVIGKGGTGMVYRARDLALERDVAIKVVRPGFRVMRKWSERFYEEARIVASFDHPHIVQIHEILDCDSTPLVVMEYVRGSNLEDAVDSHRFSRDRLVDIMISVCEAVAYAHSRGIVHCDIKPLNILLTGDGVAKVADFGIALRVDPDQDASDKPAPSEQKQIRGSPAFMSPEQARGDLAEITSRTDVYGIGATLYYALSGSPVAHGDAYAMMEQVKQGQIQPLSKAKRGIPQDLESICMKCLETEPARRYPGADLVADDLYRFRRQLPVSARRYPLRERIGRAIRFRPTTFYASVAGVLAACAVFVATEAAYHHVAKDSVIDVLKDRVKGIANTAAFMIDPRKVEAVHSPADRNTPECRDLVRVLKAVKDRNEHIDYTYIARQAEETGYVEFVATDSLFDPPKEGEPPSDVGDVYQETPKYPDMLDAFNHPTVDRQVNVLDEWNVALSGYAPIPDASGKAIAIVGVDIKSDEIAAAFRRIDRTTVLAIGWSILATLALIALIVRWRVAYWENKAAAAHHAYLSYPAQAAREALNLQGKAGPAR